MTSINRNPKLLRLCRRFAVVRSGITHSYSQPPEFWWFLNAFNRTDVLPNPKGVLITILCDKTNVTASAITDLPPFVPSSPHLHVVIETPKGCRNKYAYDQGRKTFVLKKVLPNGAVFPSILDPFPEQRQMMVTRWITWC